MVVSTYESIWFKNKETSLAMAIDNSVLTFGIVALFCTQPYIYNLFDSLFVCFGVNLIIYAFSIICGFLLVYIDRYAPIERDDEGKAFKNFSCSMFGHLGPAFWMLAIGHMLVAGPTAILSNVICAFFQDRFKLSNDLSGIIAGIAPLIMGLSAAPIGLFITKKGFKVHTSISYRRSIITRHNSATRCCGDILLPCRNGISARL